jgi:hypothetical protein
MFSKNAVFVSNQFTNQNKRGRETTPRLKPHFSIEGNFDASAIAAFNSLGVYAQVNAHKLLTFCPSGRLGKPLKR